MAINIQDAAAAIAALINSSPRTPTRDAIEKVVARHVTLGDAPEALSWASIPEGLFGIEAVDADTIYIFTKDLAIVKLIGGVEQKNWRPPTDVLEVMATIFDQFRSLGNP